MSIVLDGTSGITTPAETVSGAITASTVTATGLISGSTNYTGFKNRIINGGMVIDQRNAGAAQTLTLNTNVYTIDRWLVFPIGGTVTGQRVAGSSGTQYRYQITGGSGVTNIYVSQRIESYNCVDLVGSVCTISVDVSNSLLSSMNFDVYTPTVKDNYTSVTPVTTSPTSATISSSITRVSCTFTMPAQGANGVQIGLSVGAQTSGTWVFGNVQLEKGSVATSFDYRPYGTELSLCQRYLPCCTPGEAAYGFIGQVVTTATIVGNIQFMVEARVPPTGVTVIYAVNGYIMYNAGVLAGSTGTVFYGGNVFSGQVTVTATSAILTVGRVALFGSAASGNQYKLIFTGCEL